MKGKIVLISLFILCTNAFTQDSAKIEIINDRINSIESSIEVINEKQDYQNDQINSQTSMIDTAFDGVSTEIGSASNSIAIFGIIITLVSIGLGIYVTWITKKISQMKHENEELLGKNIQINQELEILSKKIVGDSKGLYKVVRDEESNHMIERIISVPEDIKHLFGFLTSRDLEDYHYDQLKEAYKQIIQKDPRDCKSYYDGLIFQHFSHLVVKDPELKDGYYKTLEYCFNDAFKNDIIKSVRGYFRAIKEMSISKSISDLNKYIFELCKSEYKSDEEVYFVINTVIDSRELKFELYDAISKSPDYIEFRKSFGKLIIQFKYDGLNSKEESIIIDIKSII